jgi:hypothetical protein
MVVSIIAQLINSGMDRERLMRILKLRMESSSYFTNNTSEPRDFRKLCATLIEMLQGYAARVIILWMLSMNAATLRMSPLTFYYSHLIPTLSPAR